MTLTETNFALPTHDSKKIFGTLSAVGPQSSKNCVILAHGLTGRTNEHILITARDYITDQGWDAVTYAQYTGEAEARKSVDCTLEIQAKDMETVHRHFSSRYENVFLAGHSYGGTTILFSGIEASGYCFWDASYQPADEFWRTESHELPGSNFLYISWGPHSLVSKEMREEGLSLTKPYMDRLASQVKTPSLVVLAGKTGLQHFREPLYDALSCTKGLKIFPHADHNFTAGKSAHELAKTTFEWFKALSETKGRPIALRQKALSGLGLDEFAL